MIDIEIGKALVAVEMDRFNCDKCYFYGEIPSFCEVPNERFRCREDRRNDGKNVVFKLVDWLVKEEK